MTLSNELTKETIKRFGFDEDTVQKLLAMSNVSSDTSWRYTSEQTSSPPASKSGNPTKFIIPTLSLLELAAGFANQDFLATYSRTVEFDLSRNITAVQLMSLVDLLEQRYKRIPGMEDAGDSLRICCRPLILLAVGTTVTDTDILVEWGFTPAEIDAILASDQQALEALEAGMTQLRERFIVTDAINNYRSIFFQHSTILEFTPSTRLFDFYTSHVATSSTSVWQWALNAADKLKRLASLKVESLNLLGTTMERLGSGHIRTHRDDTPYTEMRRVLES